MTSMRRPCWLISHLTMALPAACQWHDHVEGIHSSEAADEPSPSEQLQHCSVCCTQSWPEAWQYMACRLTGLGRDSSLRLPCTQHADSEARAASGLQDRMVDCWNGCEIRQQPCAVSGLRLHQEAGP